MKKIFFNPIFLILPLVCGILSIFLFTTDIANSASGLLSEDVRGSIPYECMTPDFSSRVVYSNISVRSKNDLHGTGPDLFFSHPLQNMLCEHSVSGRPMFERGMFSTELCPSAHPVRAGPISRSAFIFG